MYKIGVMGDSESVLCFTPLGIDTFAVGDREHTRETFRHMVDEKYAIIYVTEHKAVFIADYIEKYSTEQLPAVIPIPSTRGTLNQGMDKIKRAVERAVGVDILANE